MKGRKDVVGAAETGSGKTLAFGIPILHGIMKDKEFEQKKREKERACDNSQDADSETSQEESDDMEESGKGESFESCELIGSKDTKHTQIIDVVNLSCQQKKTMKSKGKLRALIITPTRELAVQIEKHLKAVAKYTNITIALVIGGMAAPKQERILNKGPDIVVGTPGRLWELIEGGNPHLSQIKDIR